MIEVKVENVCKSFGTRVILDNISFEVRQGSIHGFLGPNGAGKTTTMKVITSLLQQDSGTVTIEGSDNHNKYIINHLGFLLDNPPLYGDMSVTEYLKFLAKLRKVGPEKIEDNINYCIKSLDLSKVKDRSIENLSKGFKQRVAIAQALIHKPRIIILDEPTVGLDPQSVIEIRNLILNLKQNHTIILSSHLLHEMSLVCDQVTIISEGKIVDTGSIDNLRRKLQAKSKITLSIKQKTSELDQYFLNLKNLVHLECTDHETHIDYDLTISGEEDIREELLKMALTSGARPFNLDQQEFTLEEIFVNLTKEKA